MITQQKWLYLRNQTRFTYSLTQENAAFKVHKVSYLPRIDIINQKEKSMTCTNYNYHPS